MENMKKIVGYVRLSRDDDKKNYISIENQKLIIEKYAKTQGMVIDRWYEDDGYSGYKFDRPAFSKLINDLDFDVDTVIAKDLSRIGRHNAKVLILLDEFKELGKRLIILDDNYDTLDNEEDDIIGIKTWVNEKYVKDTSRKIKSVFKTRQKEGTLIIGVPIGYRKNKAKIEIVPLEALYIREIFDLYLQGYGRRKIANMFNEKNIPTPSMILMKRYVTEGRAYKRKTANEWSDGMVADIIKNDFYIGNLRLHKRARKMINGKDARIKKEDQLLFEGNHPPIIDKQTFDLVQEIMNKRTITNYRCQYDKSNIFGGLLFCKDCGGRMIPITRKQNKTKKYYICNRYNSKGKRYCSHSHITDEKILMEDVIHYISACRDTIGEAINKYDYENFDEEREAFLRKREMIKEKIDRNKTQLVTLLKQKIKEMALDPDNSNIIEASFYNLQRDLISEINDGKHHLSELEEADLKKCLAQEKLKSATGIIEAVIKKQSIDREDVELLIQKIIIDKNGIPDIELKNGLSSLMQSEFVKRLNQENNKDTLSVMKLIYKEKRNYTSAKYLSNEFIKMGYKKPNKLVLTYINNCIEQGILKPSEDKLKPYEILVSKEELADRIIKLENECSTGWYATDGI